MTTNRALARLMMASLIALAALPSLAQSPLDQCLGQVDLSTETARIDLLEMSNFGGGEHRLPVFDVLIEDPFKIPRYAERFAALACEKSGSLHGLISFASSRLGEVVRRGWLENPHQGIEDQLGEEGILEKALQAVWARAGRELSEADAKAAAQVLGGLPKVARERVAFLLWATADALAWHEKAFGDIAREDLDAVAKRVLSDAGGYDAATWRAMRQVDVKFLLCGAEDLAQAVDKCLPELRTAAEQTETWPTSPIALSTPLGVIAIGTPGPDTYAKGHYLLIVDPGGDDLYRGGGAAWSMDRPASVLIDLGGDDVYHCGSRVSMGAGVLGYGFLVDAAGSDLYVSAHDITQGAGRWGVGALLDVAGDDTYDAFDLAQGCGEVGVGILSDLGGEDTYDSYFRSQGYGGTRGVGMLVDVVGNDAYLANDTDIRWPSPQTKEHNTSLSQGFGYGRRADYTDGHSLAGGVGLLIDGAGDDRYSCGVFGQGAGYWYGLGMLIDRDGMDTYEGVWYVQAAGAHFAVGALIDGGGHDRYKATHNMAQGAGHDFSIGYLLDKAGDDLYEAPNLSLGGGNANGIGIFWDQAGDDCYQVTAATTLGRANIRSRGSLRAHMLCLGVFCDTGGGRDTYPEKHEFAGDDRAWTQRGTNAKEPVEMEKGCGLDR